MVIDFQTQGFISINYINTQVPVVNMLAKALRAD
jgi:hypothetical protein